MLYVSTDGGREWQPCSEAAPTDRFFRDYNAPGDGTYLFAVRSWIRSTNTTRPRFRN